MSRAKTTTIGLVLAVPLCTVVLAVLAIAQPGMPFTLRVPAASMKVRSDIVRQDVVSQHLAPLKPYPLVKAFHVSTMLPSDPRIAAQFLARGGGALKITSLGAGHATMTNEGPGPLSLPFKAVLENQEMKLQVGLPKKVQFDVQWTANSLTLKSLTPLTVNFINLPAPGGTPIPISPLQQIDSLSVTESAVTLATHKAGTGGGAFVLVLDLTAQPSRGQLMLWHAAGKILAIASIFGRH